jgi:ketosteroid isomerase-like protein
VTTLTLTGADDAEITFITVIEYRAARSSRVDIYEVEQVDDALARFDALADAGESPFENAATRAVDRFVAAWPAHDWDGLVSLYSSDLRTRDHRAVIGGGLEMDHAEFIATLRWMFEGRQEWEHDVVATRGERLALVRFRHRYELEGSGPSDSTYLNIVELDERGLVVLSEQFELDDIDAAFEALDDRFAAGEAAPFADQLSALRSWGRSVNDRNSDAIVALCTEDYEHTSHRLTGAGSYATLRDYADSLHPAAFGAEALRLEHMLGVSATAFLAVGGWRGGTPAAEVVVEMVSVVTFDGARLAGQETYDVRQLDEAHARYDAIVADERATRSLLENAATRAATRWRALWHDGDWDGWVDAHAPDFEWEDRRPLVRMQLGRAPFIEMMQTAFERTVESHWTAATLATRGERLALLRMSHTWSGHRAGQSADEMLCVYEATEDGRVARVVEFTLDQLDEAYDELDDQYEAGEAARFPDAWSAMRGWVRTIDAGDSHATEALCTDDFEHISSRLASGWSYGTRREYFDILRPATLGLDRVRLDHVLRLSGGAIVAIGSWRGEDAGAEVEIPLLCVYELRGPLIRRMHVYDPHHLEVALAKYDDVVAAREPSMFDINRVDDALARYDQLRED